MFDIRFILCSVRKTSSNTHVNLFQFPTTTKPHYVSIANIFRFALVSRSISLTVFIELFPFRVPTSAATGITASTFESFEKCRALADSGRTTGTVPWGRTEWTRGKCRFSNGFPQPQFPGKHLSSTHYKTTSLYESSAELSSRFASRISLRTLQSLKSFPMPMQSIRLWRGDDTISYTRNMYILVACGYSSILINPFFRIHDARK